MGTAHGVRGWCQAHVNIPVGTLLVVLEPLARTRHRRRTLSEVVGPRRDGPVPSRIAALAGDKEIIERDEVAGQGVVIRAQILGEESEMRVAVANLKVAEYLIVGPVFLDDVDDVTNVFAQEGKDPLIRNRVVRRSEMIVAGNLAGEPSELQCRRGRHGEKSGLFKLPFLVIVSRTKSLNRINRAGKALCSGLVLGVDDVPESPVFRDGHAGWIPAGWHKANYGRRGRSFSRVAIVIIAARQSALTAGNGAECPLAESDNGDGVLATVTNQQNAAVRYKGERVGVRAIEFFGISVEACRSRGSTVSRRVSRAVSNMATSSALSSAA